MYTSRFSTRDITRAHITREKFRQVKISEHDGQQCRQQILHHSCRWQHLWVLKINIEDIFDSGEQAVVSCHNSNNQKHNGSEINNSTTDLYADLSTRSCCFKSSLYSLNYQFEKYYDYELKFSIEAETRVFNNLSPNFSYFNKGHPPSSIFILNNVLLI